MRINKLKVLRIVLFALILSVSGALGVAAQTEVTSVPSGEKIKMKGIIAVRNADTLVIRDIASNARYNVVLMPDTKVQTYKKLVRGGRDYAASYLLRGLRIQVTGAGNGEGQIVAKEINFDEQDLRAAQALEVTVDPVEAQAEANRKRIAEEAERLSAAEENAKRLAGQIEEAEAIALKAQADADRANNRINGLDDFDAIKTIVVPFATGSSTIGPKGRSIIDEAAAWVKTQDTNGWVIAVVGFADSTGNTARNKTLSEKRTSSVISYLVSKHKMPLTRLVQPFGAGVDQPAATNATAAGRAQNRRVEIRLLRNKGIAG